LKPIRLNSFKAFTPNVKSIQFWLFFFFCIRLIGITNAPLETGHDWRQCLTNMISRNLYENNHNPFYPTVDNGGRHETGIIASEFPVFNYMVYLVSIPFGYAHWYGRLINLIISTLAAWYFYKLLKFKFSESIAFNATLLLTVSIWFGFSRKSMPDVFSMSLMLMALYYAFYFVRDKNWQHLLYFGVLGSLAVLAKLPAIYGLCVLFIPMLLKKIKTGVKVNILIVSFLIIMIANWWYFIWGDYLLTTYHYQLFFPRTLKEGLNEMAPFWKLALEQFYFSSFNSFLAFAIFLFGLVICIHKKIMFPLYIVLISFAVFIGFALKTGSVFAQHSYYIIPIVPVMALIGGIGLSCMPHHFYSWVIVLISMEAIANQHNDFFIKKSETFKLTMEDEINKFVPKHTKIALGGNTGPQYLYFAHRKGWGLSQHQTLDSTYMNYLIKHQYTYLVVVKREFSKLPNYEKVGESKDLLFYKLK
jgi:hypothetical protein